MANKWRTEIQKFRAWAATQTPQIGEWECNYEDWNPIYEGVQEFLHTPPSQWSQEETEDLLYILARDWECGSVADYIKAHPPETVLYVCEKSLEASDWDARWRLADILGYLPRTPQFESLLLRFVDDGKEYVRRRALQSLTRLKMPQVEELALREWGRDNENQPWARMNALSCWQSISSPLLEPHLQQAEHSSLQYLSEFAQKLRRGEIELL